jgi:exopolyphosphatase/guanosine-5'-triphosphate,3'-diphosphate pyrophosphatase
MEYTTLGAVDLGSNSFHLEVGRVEGEQIYPLDSLREAVRLGAGITREKNLTPEVQERALETLKRFSERLAGMPREAVRAVGTNALRMSRNSPAFLRSARKALGFPIEVISGREEARLIYLGVLHSLPPSAQNRLVVDVGGGSTEFIIGLGERIDTMESLYMGCVSYSDRFFPEGRITKKGMESARFAARDELQSIAARFQGEGWSEAVGSSGTAKAIAEVLSRNGGEPGTITAEGLEWLRGRLLDAGDSRKLDIEGLREERAAIIPGGVAILSAVFDELGIETMSVADGALRQGVMWDLLGRVHRSDIRDVTIEGFVRRYHVDQPQADRVEKFALGLLSCLEQDDESLAELRRTLAWAARLHEIGISIAYGDYHKHSAYILANADMPGFSREEQRALSAIVLAQRGKLGKMQAAFEEEPRLAALALCLRLAVVFHRARRSLELPAIRLGRKDDAFQLSLEPAWLERHPLVALALESERERWKETGTRFELG